ncbi:14 kDa proline-rich protein DC2.15 [Thalictrum thalictroides]|uniref:14 kDa proline-rich protein DC2.15 n=1 Tax=Thalictrum thalictroides TaxID=46969 RepID=A0A7J6X6J4_THATH|nr:14 kDa proline-rich protein DC2.15 [Thalictrum thalictroides]
MNSKNSASAVLFLSLNLLFFALVTAYDFSDPSTYLPEKPYKPTHEMPSFPTRAAYGRCPRDALKLGVCANLLGGLVSVEVGTPPDHPCCHLIKGLVDLEAAACLCTAIKAKVLDIINLNVSLSISLLLNTCGHRDPSGFKCGY